MASILNSFRLTVVVVMMMVAHRKAVNERCRRRSGRIRRARRHRRIALDAELDEGDLLRLGLGEFRAVARLILSMKEGTGMVPTGLRPRRKTSIAHTEPMNPNT